VSISAVITKSDGSAATGLAFDVQRGVPSAKQRLWITNTGDETILNGFLSMSGEWPVNSGIYVSEGVASVNERMGRVEIVGATDDQPVVPGSLYVLGANAVALLPDLISGQTIYIDFWLEQAPNSTAAGSFRVELIYGNDLFLVPLPLGFSEANSGILSGVGEPGRMFLISGGAMTAAGSPTITIAALSCLIDGVEYSVSGTTKDLDQTDVNAATLATGESYIALFSTDGTDINVTKGAKATAPGYPSLPAANLFLGYVTVLYGVSGSVISDGNIAQSLVYGRFLVIDGGGLNAEVGSGEAITADFLIRRSDARLIALPDDATSEVYLLPDSSLALATASGALHLASVTTASGAITGVTDRRTFIDSAPGGVPPHASTHATAGTDPVSPSSIGAAPIASPAFTGDPTATTQSPGDNSTKLATTEYVDTAITTVTAGASATDQVVVFAGDGVNQPSALSPVPATGSVPAVYKNGLIQIEGAGLDYTYDGGAHTVTFTPVLESGQTGVIRWRG
jgi:hypothetical protein